MSCFAWLWICFPWFEVSIGLALGFAISALMMRAETGRWIWW